MHPLLQPLYNQHLSFIQKLSHLKQIYKTASTKEEEKNPQNSIHGTVIFPAIHNYTFGWLLDSFYKLMKSDSVQLPATGGSDVWESVWECIWLCMSDACGHPFHVEYNGNNGSHLSYELVVQMLGRCKPLLPLFTRSPLTPKHALYTVRLLKDCAASNDKSSTNAAITSLTCLVKCTETQLNDFVGSLIKRMAEGKNKDLIFCKEMARFYFSMLIDGECRGKESVCLTLNLLSLLFSTGSKDLEQELPLLCKEYFANLFVMDDALMATVCEWLLVDIVDEKDVHVRKAICDIVLPAYISAMLKNSNSTNNSSKASKKRSIKEIQTATTDNSNSNNSATDCRLTIVKYAAVLREFLTPTTLLALKPLARLQSDAAWSQFGLFVREALSENGLRSSRRWSTDVCVLEALCLIDYSLIVGVVDLIAWDYILSLLDGEEEGKVESFISTLFAASHRTRQLPTLLRTLKASISQALFKHPTSFACLPALISGKGMDNKNSGDTMATAMTLQQQLAIFASVADEARMFVVFEGVDKDFVYEKIIPVLLDGMLSAGGDRGAEGNTGDGEYKSICLTVLELLIPHLQPHKLPIAKIKAAYESNFTHSHKHGKPSILLAYLHVHSLITKSELIDVSQCGNVSLMMMPLLLAHPVNNRLTLNNNSIDDGNNGVAATFDAQTIRDAPKWMLSSLVFWECVGGGATENDAVLSMLLDRSKVHSFSLDLLCDILVDCIPIDIQFSAQMTVYIVKECISLLAASIDAVGGSVAFDGKRMQFDRIVLSLCKRQGGVATRGGDNYSSYSVNEHDSHAIYRALCDLCDSARGLAQNDCFPPIIPLSPHTLVSMFKSSLIRIPKEDGDSLGGERLLRHCADRNTLCSLKDIWITTSSQFAAPDSHSTDNGCAYLPPRVPPCVIPLLPCVFGECDDWWQWALLIKLIEQGDLLVILPPKKDKTAPQAATAGVGVGVGGDGSIHIAAANTNDARPVIAVESPEIFAVHAQGSAVAERLPKLSLSVLLKSLPLLPGHLQTSIIERNISKLANFLNIDHKGDCNGKDDEKVEGGLTNEFIANADLWVALDCLLVRGGLDVQSIVCPVVDLIIANHSLCLQQQRDHQDTCQSEQERKTKIYALIKHRIVAGGSCIASLPTRNILSILMHREREEEHGDRHSEEIVNILSLLIGSPGAAEIGSGWCMHAMIALIIHCMQSIDDVTSNHNNDHNTFSKASPSHATKTNIARKLHRLINDYARAHSKSIHRHIAPIIIYICIQNTHSPAIYPLLRAMDAANAATTGKYENSKYFGGAVFDGISRLLLGGVDANKATVQNNDAHTRLHKHIEIYQKLHAYKGTV